MFSRGQVQRPRCFTSVVITRGQLAFVVLQRALYRQSLIGCALITAGTLLYAVL
ncbi:MAG: hypothetical protein ACLVJH_13025 [Faecalibacterium prausnitzii]